MKTPSWLLHVGASGIAGIGLLLFAAAFALGTLKPDFEERARLDAELATLAAQVPVRTAGTASEAPPKTVPGTLSPLATDTQRWQEIRQAAERAGLAIRQSSFRIDKSQATSVRYEVSFPLSGSYPAIRAFLKEVLALAPYATLEACNLRRGSAGDPLLEAEIRLGYAFATP